MENNTIQKNGIKVQNYIEHQRSDVRYILLERWDVHSFSALLLKLEEAHMLQPRFRGTSSYAANPESEALQPQR